LRVRVVGCGVRVSAAVRVPVTTACARARDHSHDRPSARRSSSSSGPSCRLRRRALLCRASAVPGQCGPGQCWAGPAPAATFGPAALCHGPRILPRLVLQRIVRALRVSPPDLPFTSARGLGSPLPTSAPGLGSPRPHLRRDWAHPCARLCALGSPLRTPVCTGLGLHACMEARGRLCPISQEARGGLFVCLCPTRLFVCLFAAAR
jgi:hypothetical protein